jgi:hypothetical protein
MKAKHISNLAATIAADPNVINKIESVQAGNGVTVDNTDPNNPVIASVLIGDLQSAYNNSLTPEIVTDATRGATTVKIGTGVDTDFTHEGKNQAGTTTFSVDGNGDSVQRNIESTKQFKSKTLYGNTTTANDFVFDCDNGMVQELDMEGQTADGQITITNPIEGNTYSLIVIQGAGLFNISLPTGWWINDFVFSFGDLIENDRAIVTISYVNGVWNFAAKKLTLISNP